MPFTDYGKKHNKSKTLFVTCYLFHIVHRTLTFQSLDEIDRRSTNKYIKCCMLCFIAVSDDVGDDDNIHRNHIMALYIVIFTMISMKVTNNYHERIVYNRQEACTYIYIYISM